MTVDYGPRSALVVVDVQNDFADPDGSLYVRGGAAAIVAVQRGDRGREGRRRAGSSTRRTGTRRARRTSPRTAACGRCTASPARGAPSCTPTCRRRRAGAQGQRRRGRLLGLHDGATPRPATTSSTGLAELLRSHGVETVVVVGLATDYCVKATALDAVGLGFRPPCSPPAVRAVDLEPGDGERALDEMRAAGAPWRDPRPIAMSEPSPPPSSQPAPSTSVPPSARRARARHGHRPLRADHGRRATTRPASTHEATFELFVRRLPAERRFLVAAGLDAALAGLEAFGYGDGDARPTSRALGLFPPGFLDLLVRAALHRRGVGGPRGRGGVRRRAAGARHRSAGRGPAGRDVPAQPDRQPDAWWRRRRPGWPWPAATAAFVDFSARRDHGVDAAMAAARAAWIARRRAARRWWPPGSAGASRSSGTMAHSFVMAFDDERDAFRAYARGVPPVGGPADRHLRHRRAGPATPSRWPTSCGARASGWRASGSTRATSPRCRSRCARSSTTPGSRDVHILASGDLDEHRIVELLAAGAAVDAFGVGTQLGT